MWRTEIVYNLVLCMLVGLCEMKLKIHLNNIAPLSYGRQNKLSISSRPSVSLLSLSVLVLYSLVCMHLCMWTACSSFMLMVQVFWADGCPDILKGLWWFWGTTVIWNVWNYLPSDTVWHTKRLKSGVTPQWGPHRSQVYVVRVWRIGILWHWSFFQTLGDAVPVYVE